jgi:hypothetical protein
VITANLTECFLGALGKCAFREDITTSTSTTTTTRAPRKKAVKITTPAPEDSYFDESAEEEQQEEQEATVSMSGGRKLQEGRSQTGGNSSSSSAGQEFVEILKGAGFCDTVALEQKLDQVIDYAEGILRELESRNREETSEAVQEISESEVEQEDAAEASGNGGNGTKSVLEPESGGGETQPLPEENGLAEESVDSRARMTREAEAEHAANATALAVRKDIFRMRARLAGIFNDSLRRMREEVMQVPVLWIRPLADSLQKNMDLHENLSKGRDERLREKMDSILAGQRAARETPPIPGTCLWEGQEMIGWRPVERWFNESLETAARLFLTELRTMRKELADEMLVAVRIESRRVYTAACINH